MMKSAMKKEKSKRSKRERECDAMLEEALKRPGAREVMQVYQNWEEADQGLDSYRQATKEPMRMTTTDRTNPI